MRIKYMLDGRERSPAEIDAEMRKHVGPIKADMLTKTGCLRVKEENKLAVRTMVELVPDWVECPLALSVSTGLSRKSGPIFKVGDVPVIVMYVEAQGTRPVLRLPGDARVSQFFQAYGPPAESFTAWDLALWGDIRAMLEKSRAAGAELLDKVKDRIAKIDAALAECP